MSAPCVSRFFLSLSSSLTAQDCSLKNCIFGLFPFFFFVCYPRPTAFLSLVSQALHEHNHNCVLLSFMLFVSSLIICSLYNFGSGKSKGLRRDQSRIQPQYSGHCNSHCSCLLFAHNALLLFLFSHAMSMQTHLHSHTHTHTHAIQF